jgi:hypothetical protein
MDNINRTSTSTNTSSEVVSRNRISMDFDDLFTRKLDNSIPEITVTDTSLNIEDNTEENSLLNDSQENLLENHEPGNTGLKNTFSKIIKRSRSENNLLKSVKYFLNNISESSLNNKHFPLVDDKILRIYLKDYIGLSDHISMIKDNFNNLPVSINKKYILNFYDDLFNNIEDFKNIQTCLLNIKNFNKIDVILDHYRFEYLSGSKITANSNFIKDLHKILIDDRLLFVSDINTFKEFYVLNDLDYLNYKNKNQIIELKIYINL